MKFAALALLAVLVAPGLALAGEGGGAGIEAHASTLGFGPEINFAASPDVVLRFDYNYYNNYSYRTTKEQILYDAHLHLKSYGAALDWHPGAGPFLVSLGVFSNHNDIDAIAVPQQTYVLAGQLFQAADLGNVTAHITFNSVAPYLGIGFSSLSATDSGLGFNLNLGVYYQGSPKVSLTGNGPLFGSSVVQPAVQTEQSRLEHDWENYRYYPVVTLGITYRF